MVKKYNDFDPQLESAVLTDKAKLSLYKKSVKSGIPTGILEEVYRRGINTWNPQFGYTAEQFGFDRVNSFIAGGFAAQLDEDLKKACWKGYEAVGMKMKNGKKVPNCVPVKEQLDRPLPSVSAIAKKFDTSTEAIKKAIKHGSTVEKEHTKEQKTAERIATAHVNERPDYYKKLEKAGLEEDTEKHSKNPKDPASRFIGSNELTDIYKQQTPGQIIRKVVREQLDEISHGLALKAMKASEKKSEDDYEEDMGGDWQGHQDRADRLRTHMRKKFGNDKPGRGSADNDRLGDDKGYGRIPSDRLTRGPRAGLPSKQHVNQLKTNIKFSIGKHTKPNLPEETGVYEASIYDNDEHMIGDRKPIDLPKGHPDSGKAANANYNLKVAKQQHSHIWRFSPNNPEKKSFIAPLKPDSHKILSDRVSHHVGEYDRLAKQIDSSTTNKIKEAVLEAKKVQGYQNWPGEKKKKFFQGPKDKDGKTETQKWAEKRKAEKSQVDEATYQGKKVPLNKPMKGDVKKSKVYVDPDGDGKAQKVNFGDKNMSIKKDQPARKKSYCARSGGQGNLNDKTSPNYWSRKAWNCEEVETDNE